MEVLFSTNNGRVTFQGKPISDETAMHLRGAIRREADKYLYVHKLMWGIAGSASIDALKKNLRAWNIYHQLNDALDAIWRKEEVA